MSSFSTKTKTMNARTHYVKITQKSPKYTFEMWILGTFLYENSKIIFGAKIKIVQFPLIFLSALRNIGST